MAKSYLLIVTIFFSVTVSAADFSLKLGRTFMFDGINCHSAALQAAGVMKYPSHVTGHELEFIFRTQCKEVSKPQAGAIGITGIGTMFSHSFFYIQPDKIFQKKSLDKKTSYEILKGGPVRQARYFVCSRDPNDCSDPQVTRLKEATEKVGHYFAAFMLSADNMKQRDLRNQQLITLQKWTKELRNIAPECKREVRRLELRQDALRHVSERLSGAGFYLGLIPRTVGRD